MTGGRWIAKGESEFIAAIEAGIARKPVKREPVRAPLAEVARVNPAIMTSDEWRKAGSVAALRARSAFAALFSGGDHAGSN